MQRGATHSEKRANQQMSESRPFLTHERTCQRLQEKRPAWPQASRQQEYFSLRARRSARVRGAGNFSTPAVGADGKVKRKRKPTVAAATRRSSAPTESSPALMIVPRGRSADAIVGGGECATHMCARTDDSSAGASSPISPDSSIGRDKNFSGAPPSYSVHAVIREYKSSLQWNLAAAVDMPAALQRRLTAADAGGLQLGLYALVGAQMQAQAAGMLASSTQQQLLLQRQWQSSEGQLPRAAEEVSHPPRSTSPAEFPSTATTAAATAAPPLTAAGTSLPTGVLARLESLESGEAAQRVVGTRDLAAVTATVRSSAAAIRAGRFHPTPSIMVCGMCPFKGVCHHEADSACGVGASSSSVLAGHRAAAAGKQQRQLI